MPLLGTRDAAEPYHIIALHERDVRHVVGQPPQLPGLLARCKPVLTDMRLSGRITR